MKKLNCILLILVTIVFCSCQAQEKIVVSIDNIDITESEFEEAFEGSRYAADGKEGRVEFLNKYIATKLILKEAEEQGIDKDPQFLSEIQSFWEKALLKLVLSNKSEELASSIDIPDQEIRKYYKRHKGDLFIDKELSDVYGQIEWFIIAEKQATAMEEWSDSLREQAEIKINYRHLGIDE